MRLDIESIGTIPPENDFGMTSNELDRKCEIKAFGCQLTFGTHRLLARTSFPALWILIGMVRDRPRCFLMDPGYSRLILVMQTVHKEHMRIRKRFHWSRTSFVFRGQRNECERDTHVCGWCVNKTDHEDEMRDLLKSSYAFIAP